MPPSEPSKTRQLNSSFTFQLFWGFIYLLKGLTNGFHSPQCELRFLAVVSCCLLNNSHSRLSPDEHWGPPLRVWFESSAEGHLLNTQTRSGVHGPLPALLGPGILTYWQASRLSVNPAMPGTLGNSVVSVPSFFCSSSYKTLYSLFTARTLST